MPNRLPAEKPSRENTITTMTAIRTMIAERAFRSACYSLRMRVNTSVGSVFVPTGMR